MKTKLAATGGASAQTFVDDVFSTYLYTGNGSTQTITNGIDLAGKGGLVWIKSRSNSTNHKLIDSAQAASSTNWNDALVSNSTASAIYPATGIITAQTTGFQITSPDNGFINENTYTYASWTFRKAAKFFDVLTYTGTGSARTIAHSLGVAPGMIIVKRTDTTGNWQVYSNGLTSAAYSIQLNLTNAQASAPTVWNSTAPTSSVFSVGTDATVNASGGTYVAYLYAHDTSSTGIIQCGSYAGNGGLNTINLGYEAQWVMIKCISNGTTISNWGIYDCMRGMPNGTANTPSLNANTANAEEASAVVYSSATGFTINDGSGRVNGSGDTYIYMAIRRPNKPPTSGTQVYNAIARTGTGVAATVTGVGFAPDLELNMPRNHGGLPFHWFDRLRGASPYLASNGTGAEAAGSSELTSFDMNGITIGINNQINGSAYTYINHFFKRAPGFFDVVCYTGVVGSKVIKHSLGAAPELIISKTRSSAEPWYVWHKDNSPEGFVNACILLNSSDWHRATAGNSLTTFTSTSFVSWLPGSVNTAVAYLFATLAGISKVGSYTGNGTSQNIECGFAAGARFFLVKATSTTGSWWVWDSARGITAGNDSTLQLNSTAAEITTADAVDPYSPGITVNQEATCSINANGVSYIFLAVA